MSDSSEMKGQEELEYKMLSTDDMILEDLASSRDQISSKSVGGSV